MSTRLDVTVPQKIEGVEVQVIADENGVQMNVEIDGGWAHMVKLVPQENGHLGLTVMTLDDLDNQNELYGTELKV